MSLPALLPVLLAVAALIALVIGALALLQRASGRCLQGGTCGRGISCASCRNRKAGCAAYIIPSARGSQIDSPGQ